MSFPNVVVDRYLGDMSNSRIRGPEQYDLAQMSSRIAASRMESYLIWRFAIEVIAVYIESRAGPRLCEPGEREESHERV
jgi:hypothetical protein